MKVYICDEEMKVIDAPIGLLIDIKSGEIILKTEYQTQDRCECFIVSSGETYIADGKSDEQIVKPIIVE